MSPTNTENMKEHLGEAGAHLKSAASAAGSAVSMGTSSVSITAKRSFVVAAAQALAGTTPLSSAIQVGLPASSNATASGSVNAVAETPSAPPERKCAVPASGANSRA